MVEPSKSTGGRVERLPTGGMANLGGAASGTGGIIFASGGAVATGGRTSASTGGLMPNGGSGVTGGAPTEPPPLEGPDLSRYVPFLCWDPCQTFADCPSPDPYIADCGQLTSSCIFRCEGGCPPDTEMLHINGGCLCYHPDIRASGGPSECCSTGDCGAPYHLSCCDGMRCVDGSCR